MLPSGGKQLMRVRKIHAPGIGWYADAPASTEVGLALLTTATHAVACSCTGYGYTCKAFLDHDDRALEKKREGGWTKGRHGEVVQAILI